MTRRRALATGMLLGLLWTGEPWASGLPVVDAALNSLGLIQLQNQIREYAAMLRQLQNEAQQIQNQITQIQHAASTVEQGARNLLTLRVNNARDLFGLVDQLEGKLAQAQAMGYTTERAMAQAKDLYPRIMGVLPAAEQRVLALRWNEVQRDNALVAVRTQAMQTAQQQYQQKWHDLLEKAAVAQGNLEIQQVQAQQQGLIGTQLLSIEQQLATSARQASARDLRDAAQREMEQAAVSSAVEVIATTYESQGRLLPMPRTGRE
jgi:hypothetical protein